MKRVITFNDNGNGHYSGLLRIPMEMLKIVGISSTQNDISMLLVNNKIIVKKGKHTGDSRKITFDSKGIGILRIPPVYLEVLHLSKEDREVSIILDEKNIIISKNNKE